MMRSGLRFELRYIRNGLLRDFITWSTKFTYFITRIRSVRKALLLIQQLSLMTLKKSFKVLKFSQYPQSAYASFKVVKSVSFVIMKLSR